MLPQPQYPHGKRLVVSMIDERARQTPQSPWVSIPINNNDLSHGYRDITYAQFANAINHAVAWMKANVPRTAASFPPFAYAGPTDIRYPILAVAAAKLSFTILVPSTFATPSSQLHILKQRGCSIFLHAQTWAKRVQQVAELDSSIQAIVVPDLDYFLTNVVAPPSSFEKTWEEAKDDPWIVFNTSGSTGFPKAVTHSLAMFSFPEFLLGLSNSIGKSNFQVMRNCRWLLGLPLLHIVGMATVLSMTTFLDSTLVLPPPELNTSPLTIEALQHARIMGAITLPARLDFMVKDVQAFELLKSLDWIGYAGARLSQDTGDLLAPHVLLLPAIGSTEAGPYLIEIVNTHTDWDYVKFQPHAGIEMEQRVHNLFEQVYVRTPGALQPIFGAYPQLDRFPTGDLWSEHPNPAKKGQWRLAGRTDDLLKLADGIVLYVTDLEAILMQHPSVRFALIGGTGRAFPIIVIEATDEDRSSVSQEDGKASTKFLGSFRPYIDRVNETCTESIKFIPDFVLLTRKEKPFPRTTKEIPSRGDALAMYNGEIEAMYAALEAE